MTSGSPSRRVNPAISMWPAVPTLYGGQPGGLVDDAGGHLWALSGRARPPQPLRNARRHSLPAGTRAAPSATCVWGQHVATPKAGPPPLSQAKR